MTTFYIILAALVGFGGLVWAIAAIQRRRGRSEATGKAAEGALEQANKARANEETVAGLSDAELDKRLRDSLDD